MLEQLKIITNDAGNDTCIHNIPEDSVLEFVFDNGASLNICIGDAIITCMTDDVYIKIEPVNI